MNTDKNNTQLPTTAVKCRFFSQYWGQEILGSTHFKNVKSVIFNYDLFGSLSTSKGVIGAIEAFETYFLDLKPLSQITDEDAIEFFDIVWSKVGSHKNKPKEFKIDFGKDWAMSPTSERYGLIPTGMFNGVDWLRSKGYALPFMEYSVEDLISFGWVQLG